MPEYIFVDRNGHTVKTVMSFAEYTSHMPICPKCGEAMYRKYQAPEVTWGGLKPSKGEYSPEMKQFLDSAPQRREEFEKEHERHEHESAH